MIGHEARDVGLTNAEGRSRVVQNVVGKPFLVVTRQPVNLTLGTDRRTQFGNEPARTVEGGLRCALERPGTGGTYPNSGKSRMSPTRTTLLG